MAHLTVQAKRYQPTPKLYARQLTGSVAVENAPDELT
jgi:hypothetical protein